MQKGSKKDKAEVQRREKEIGREKEKGRENGEERKSWHSKRSMERQRQRSGIGGEGWGERRP